MSIDLFNKFKDENDNICHNDLKRILNLLSLDLNNLEFKDKYNYDEFLLIINNKISNSDYQITKKQFISKLKNKFDSNTLSYITDVIFKDSDTVSISDIKLFD